MKIIAYARSLSTGHVLVAAPMLAAFILVSPEASAHLQKDDGLWESATALATAKRATTYDRAALRRVGESLERIGLLMPEDAF